MKNGTFWTRILGLAVMVILALAFTACEGPEGPAGQGTVINITIEGSATSEDISDVIEQAIAQGKVVNDGTTPEKAINLTFSGFSIDDDVAMKALFYGIEGYYVNLDLSALDGINYTSYRLAETADKSRILSITLADKVRTVYFSGYTGLKTFKADGIINIGNSAFSSCRSLTSVTIPNGVTSIGSSAFSGCTSLASVTIPNGVTSIGGGAFSGCTSLPSVTIPNSVTEIGSQAFSSCSSLTSVTIGSGVTSIEQYTFYQCTSLASVTIPDSVTSIGTYAFYQCTSLASVTIGSGVTSIGSAAFYGCTGLASVTIPNSVTEIGSSAFSYCTSLTSVIFATGSNISDTNFGTAFPEGSSGSSGNTLKTAYSTGKAGTYTREANGSTWTKSS